MTRPPPNNQWWTDDQPNAGWMMIALVIGTIILAIIGGVWGILHLIWWLI